MYVVVLAHPHRGGGPFPHTIDGENRRLRERRWEERARRVRFVVLGEQQVPIEIAANRVEDHPVLVELFLDPQRAGHEKGPKPLGSDAQVSFKNSLKLDERLVVEADVVKIRRGDAGPVEAEVHRVFRERGVPLLSRKALLRARGDDLTISYQTGSTIVVERRNPEDVNGLAQCSHRTSSASVSNSRFSRPTGSRNRCSSK